ncbi:MAG: peptidase T [Treponema sp.]|jgi:tripeptide aminopeptidase|nr:peptidase T [Treponema sp.]
MNTPIASIQEDSLTRLLVPRFLTYVKLASPSDRHAGGTPSTPEQWDLARLLAQELRDLGLSQVELTAHCYVIARIPATPGRETAPGIGFLAHMDVSPDAPGRNVAPVLVERYDGKPISLADGLSLDPATDPELSAQKGQAIIHTDGRTLLGADDKAGVAEIMAAAEYLLTNPDIVHGPLEIIFTPDEEIGAGLAEFPLESIRSVVCYTLDGGPAGEFEAECFNAYEALVAFKGRSIHPGTARGKLLNAVTMAAVFTAMLPRNESPEAADGRYGFYCPSEIRGGHEEASLELIIRDFDMAQVTRRLAALDAFARAVEAQFPGGEITVKVNPQYYNMRDKIEARPEVLDKLSAAAENLGIPFHFTPIRGGTDGSRLTELGIPTPNIFTGGNNFHSRTEWLAVSGMVSACRMILELVRLWGL